MAIALDNAASFGAAEIVEGKGAEPRQAAGQNLGLTNYIGFQGKYEKLV